MPPLWQPPPRARKMTPERPFPSLPVLIETGKSDPKTGLFPAVFRRFSDSFASGLPVGGFPAVFQRFCGFPAVFQRFSSGFPVVSDGFPAFQRFCREFSSGFPTPVFQRFCREFSNGFFPTVFQRFSGGFPAASSFLGKFDGGWTTVSRQHASPGSTPSRLRHPPSSEKTVGNSVHSFTPTNPA